MDAFDAGRALLDAARVTGEGFQRVIVAVDDTDDLTKATSTGAIARRIADEAESLGGRVRLGVTRHQLLMSDDVPYTSHNSAMAFEADIPPGAIASLRERAVRVIGRERAETSDPGLCVAALPVRPADGDVALAGELVSFGRRAKAEFCPVESAYGLAARIGWVELSEHGGTGAGVVGALAGVGLRLSGSDGRFRGKLDLSRSRDRAEPPRAGALADQLACRFAGPVRIVDEAGADLPASTAVEPVREVKAVLLGGALAIVCDIVQGTARPCMKVDLGKVGNGSWERTCESFAWDNDSEELLDGRRSCRNCLHRRWTARGFECVVGRVGVTAGSVNRERVAL